MEIRISKSEIRNKFQIQMTEIQNNGFSGTFDNIRRKNLERYLEGSERVVVLNI